MPIVTITTDFGLRDGFVGILKGVIYGIAPEVKLVDISHTIVPQDIREGALILWRAAPFFPAGTVHLYVVDPGVGTQRRALAGRLGEHYFVGPDNGLLTPLIQEAEQNKKPIEFVQLDNPKYWLPKISRTFHGRDIFAPSVAHLASGVPLSELGTPLEDPVRIQLARPEKTEHGWKAHITAIDVFGNLTTDLAASLLPERNQVIFRLRGAEVQGVAESYGHRQPGDLIAVVDSEDFLEIAVVNGNAAQWLEANVGDIVEVIDH